MLAWKIRTGTWKGIRLDGLKIVASVYGEENLGAFPESARKSILFVDDRATAEQKNALVEAFTAKYRSAIGTVHSVRSVSIEFMMALDGASVRVGDLMTLDAQKVAQIALFFDGIMVDQDRLGGAFKKLSHPELAKDEELAYTPFIPLTSYSLGRSLLYSSSDKTFDLTWKDARTRMSVFTGTFAF